jgi:hypothetical protein
MPPVVQDFSDQPKLTQYFETYLTASGSMSTANEAESASQNTIRDFNLDQSEIGIFCPALQRTSVSGKLAVITDDCTLRIVIKGQFTGFFQIAEQIIIIISHPGEKSTIERQKNLFEDI